MKIGELSARTGVPVETIRYYEQKGLLPPPERQSNNYRHYAQRHETRLVFIRQCRGLDMTLEEIEVLLRAVDQPQASCDVVNQLLDEHIDHVVQRLRQLQTLEVQLRELRSRCQGQDTAQHCGILAELVNMPELSLPAASPGKGL